MQLWKHHLLQQEGWNGMTHNLLQSFLAAVAVVVLWAADGVPGPLHSSSPNHYLGVSSPYVSSRHTIYRVLDRTQEACGPMTSLPPEGKLGQGAHHLPHAQHDRMLYTRAHFTVALGGACLDAPSVFVRKRSSPSGSAQSRSITGYMSADTSISALAATSSTLGVIASPT